MRVNFRVTPNRANPSFIQPAEIVGLRIRAPANALSTASNWIFNFMVVMVTGPSFQNILWGTYIGKNTKYFHRLQVTKSPETRLVFACLNAFIIPIVYFFFPETAGRSLEGDLSRIDIYPSFY